MTQVNHVQRPMYLHGLEGNPEGTKGDWMTQPLGATAPKLPARANDAEALAKSVVVAKDAILKDQPHLIVASSFGGAVLRRILDDNVWRGPCVFLAQAGGKYGISCAIPDGVPAILIHARADQIVPFAHSEHLARISGPEVKLWPTEGDHRLHHITKDGTLYRAVMSLI